MNVLITGGTGLIGQALTWLLLSKGYKVSCLSRRNISLKNVTLYRWDITRNFIEEKAITTADYIIHLAGANIAEKRWTKKRKQKIIDSRVKTAELIFEKLKTTPHHIKAVISASGIGYYGDRDDQLLTEESKPVNDFLSISCQQWEKAVNKMADLNLRVVINRMGIVLSKQGGGLPKLDLPVKWHLGPIFGNGKQLMSWIHIEDLCNIFLHAIENEKIKGTYNAVAPGYCTNKSFIKTIAKALNKKILLFKVPEFLLYLGLGQMADLLCFSNKVSCEKIIATGFKFRYPELLTALKQIYGKS